MHWVHLLSCFSGGAFAANGVPHFVSGTLGRPFQSPFAKPPGKGLSSSTVNVVWGFANLAVGYVLLCRVGTFDVQSAADAAAAGTGVLGMGLLAAHLFGPLHGGRTPGSP